ncbi:helix-turn-helix domain-containing protein [Halomonas sp. BC04]|uniref:helix-turn-helix domain-containing protein n=1 Tax=Halomonas sp. BC04 TaxID=1403540 RepID=UPI0004B8D895|nr:AraC family transcriptional regulator [Halomonas sp. BC04]
MERRFRETLGVGPQKFARDLRLRYGLWLLHYSGKSITEIGERCGFADTAHFSRQFRSAFDMTPSQMRKRVGESSSDRVDPFFLHIEGRPAL